MAKIKLTAFMDGISGKVNGTVFSSNRGGAYARSKGKGPRFKAGSDLSDTVNVLGSEPTIQTGSPQGQSISILTSISRLWRTLDGNARIAWNNAVEDWKRADVFGDMRVPSGSQLFTRLNATQQNMALHRVDTTSPLSLIEYPPVARIALFDINAAQFQILAGGIDEMDNPIAPSMRLAAFAVGPVELSNDMGILIEMSRPVSAGISATNDGMFRQISLINNLTSSENEEAPGRIYSLTMTMNTINTLALYQQRFGVDLSAGTTYLGAKVFVRLTAVSLTDGTKNHSQVFSCLIQPRA